MTMCHNSKQATMIGLYKSVMYRNLIQVNPYSSYLALEDVHIDKGGLPVNKIPHRPTVIRGNFGPLF